MSLNLHPTDWSGPQPRDFIVDLLAQGFPPEAVREDDSLALDIAAKHGWIAGPGYLTHQVPETPG